MPGLRFTVVWEQLLSGDVEDPHAVSHEPAVDAWLAQVHRSLIMPHDMSALCAMFGMNTALHYVA